MILKKIEVQVGIGLNGFFPVYHTIYYQEQETNPKLKKRNASFAIPYKGISKSAKNKKSKL
jgi:hypothetical protein